MKTYNKYILSALVSIFLLGCSDDFLERPDLINENSENFYQTELQAMQALISVYDGLQTYGHSANLITSDVLSDHSYAGGSDANDAKTWQELNTFSVPAQSDRALEIYKRNYIGIYRANLYLEIIDGIDASDAFKTRTSAEAKFLRAYFYFELVRYFENIPLMTETIKGSDETVAQADPVDVYNLIASDLYDAIAGLPSTIASADLGRLSKAAAQTYLGRVFLFYNGVYGADLMAGDVTLNRAAVLAQMEDVVANSGHELLDDYALLFRLQSEYSVESIFEIGHGDQSQGDWGYINGVEGNLVSQRQGPRAEYSNGNWDRGWSFAPVSHKLVNAFDPADERLDATVLFESEMDGDPTDGFQHTAYFSQKYTSDKEHLGSQGSTELNRTANMRIIRFSDALLMAAELGSPNAQDYLDRVRTRAGLPSITATAENIYNERQFEFALEGLRYFDLLRKGLDFTANAINQTGERGPLYVGDQAIFDVTFNAATKGFLPIPQEAIDLSNGVIVQNDGY